MELDNSFESQLEWWEGYATDLEDRNSANLNAIRHALDMSDDATVAEMVERIKYIRGKHPGRK